MKISRPILLMLLSLLVLAACAPATPMATPMPPEAGPTDAPPLLDLDALSPGDILVQRDYEPGFMRPEVQAIYGRVPPFTLFADGTLVYLQPGAFESDQKVMQVTLTPVEALGLLESVLQAGFERLESHTDFCKDVGGGVQECVADASTAVLRVRLPGGELREIKIYHDFANDPAAFATIDNLLSGYDHPAAQPYEPAGATLFLRPLDQAGELAPHEWLLDSSWLSGLDYGAFGMLAVPLQGEALAAVLPAFPGKIGDAVFGLEGGFYAAYLVPWLPGMDFSAAIQGDYPGVPPIPAP